MPGIIMENGSTNGARTNHERDQVVNGTNGDLNQLNQLSRPSENGKGAVEIQDPPSGTYHSNGVNGAKAIEISQSQNSMPEPVPRDLVEQMRSLPPEIIHITEGFEPLSNLLTRLAQVTHDRLSSKILELAAMPTPLSAVNGNGNGVSHGNTIDDNSVDNVKKKVALLKFVEETHANWTKALVITQWSRISEDVSKVIDLKVHLDGQRNQFEGAVYDMSEVKRSLVHARVPNPDLRTAVEVLSTGKASWMPDLGYIEPPPLTAKELLKSLQDLNTLLSIRLNIHEYDKIPYYFRSHTIKSGRVTFRVEGEFEVDLTIADEDPLKQFWFIDFRFLFSPAVSKLPEHLHYVIENRVNTALEKDGLLGCYKFLHEFVLTHKITELRKQALELSRGRWIETLQIEPLHRALSIQYWVDRYGKDGPKSWFILGVSSGKSKDGKVDEKATSRITIRWFRDSKEVKDAVIPLELNTLSIELLLQDVIGRHISHILSTTYAKLHTDSLYATRVLSLSLQQSSSVPNEPELKVQLTTQDHISVVIEPVTGRFAISPASRLASQAEWKLNNQTRDPSVDARDYIENLRCVSVSEAITSRALSVGWIPIRNPGIKPEDLKAVVPRDTMQLSWFRRPGWVGDWVVAMSSSMSGERWWLMEIINSADGIIIRSKLQIPLSSVTPNPTHSFLSGLHVFAAGLVTQFVNQRALRSRRAMYIVKDTRTAQTESRFKLPALLVKLPTIYKSKRRSNKSWAKDIIKITFQGLDARTAPSPLPQDSSTASIDHTRQEDKVERTVTIAEANMLVPMPPGLLTSTQRIDSDIAFHPASGAFVFRLKTQVGEPAIVALTERLQRVEQLVDFVRVVKQHEKTLHCETVSLGRVVFNYGLSEVSPPVENSTNGVEIIGKHESYRAVVNFTDTSNPLSLTLEAFNPHSRIVDHLSKTLNSPMGLEGVATLLPLTLPVLRGLDAIETGWEMLADKGEVLVFTRSAEWYTIRYTLYAPPTSSAEDLQKEKDVTLNIRLQHRNKVPWWCISRQYERGASGVDEFDVALNGIWEDESADGSWMGMQKAAIAKSEGAEQLLQRIDMAMREVVIIPSAEARAPAMVETRPQSSNQIQAPHQISTQDQSQTQAPQPPPPKQQQQQRQNQNQNQNQANGHGQRQSQQQNARAHAPQHDMIIID